MNANILMAVDWSKSAMNAVRYVANLLSNNPDVSVTLIHVIKPYPYVGPLETAPLGKKLEHEVEKTTFEDTEDDKGKKALDRARTMLLDAGFNEQQVQTKYVEPLPARNDVAFEILEECKAGNYDTIVIGKRGLSGIERYLTGTVTEKLVRHAKGHAVWVIE